MQLEHRFTVPAPIDEAWKVLLDAERVAPCLPGATLDSVQDGEYAGRVKVKVGPIQITYSGTARFTETDEAARRAVLTASGRETRGSGTANATMTMTMHGDGDKTDVVVATDLSVTGRPAQFGRGVMADVGERLIGRFADCLAQLFVPEAVAQAAQPEAVAQAAQPEAVAQAAQPEAVAQAAQPAEPTPAARLSTVGPQESEPIDLLDVAGLPVLKRVLPAVALLAALIAVWALFRRRRH